MKNELTPNEKNMFDALKSVADFWWQRFDIRMVNIWKMSISLWTALVAFLGFVASDKIFKVGEITCIEKFVLLGMSLVILFMHVFFVYKAAQAHKIDRGKFRDIEKRYLELIDHKYPDQIIQKSELAHDKTDSKRQWAHFFIVVITLILLVIIILVSFEKS